MHENFHGHNKRFPIMLNGVLENILVCARCFSKQAQSVVMVPQVFCLFRLFGYFRCVRYLCPSCALEALMILN